MIDENFEKLSGMFIRRMRMVKLVDKDGNTIPSGEENTPAKENICFLFP